MYNCERDIVQGRTMKFKHLRKILLFAAMLEREELYTEFRSLLKKIICDCQSGRPGKECKPIKTPRKEVSTNQNTVN